MAARKELGIERLTVFIRVDSSYQMGTGHLMRCLTLAEELNEKGAEAVFICRDHPGNLSQAVREKGFSCCLFPLSKYAGHEDNHEYASWIGGTCQEDAALTAQIIEDYSQKDPSAKLLVVDHYGLDYRWERKLRPYVDRIMVIDDLANRHHDCDFLLDQNLYENMEARYNGLVPEHCRLFLGPRYALIRKEFKEAKKKMKERTGEIKRILIFMGGTDPTNETMKALKAVEMLERPDIAVDVVVGAKNPHAKEIEEKCRQMPNAIFYLQTNRMAELMAQADLAIGGGGTTTWERCYMELPSLVMQVAENQSEMVRCLERLRMTMNLGLKEDVDSYSIAEILHRIMQLPSLLYYMSEMCRKLGVASEQVPVLLFPHV